MQAVLAPSLPPHCCLSLKLMLVLHAGPHAQCQLGLSCYHPIDGYHPSPLPSALLEPGTNLVWRWGDTHSSLDHTLCLMLILIGLARPKKVCATVKLCLWGGDCQAKSLGSFSHAKSYRVSFRFTPKLSDQVVLITEESDFYTRYRRNNLHDSNKGKKRDLLICRYSNSCRYSRCR